MLGKTHLAVGIAAALAVTAPSTPAACFTAIIGGAVGGVLPDVDTIRNDGKKGAPQVQFFAAAVTVGLLLLDSVLHTGLWDSLAARKEENLLMGAGLFATLWIMGFWSDHRSFTHSLLAVSLFTWTVNMIYPPLSICFLTGYASHLILDYLNKRPLKLLYPLDSGFCSGVFYSNREANTAFLYIGSLVAAYFIARVWLPI